MFTQVCRHARQTWKLSFPPIRPRENQEPVHAVTGRGDRDLSTEASLYLEPRSLARAITIRRIPKSGGQAE